ncbi:MAG: DegT/DnrJ/EryC1/StrS family aminotransferase [Desulfobacterales bacterium]|uniref:DegT/DnrJ/EryC1/StrS family aminotransferase n=1 Tax=Candidatus Desulfaltia bathyphila TaxID=2841697 RepID=A0A8J6T9Q7_9BACT|nr:DegT/DnrJ/EryC1/StrS family aminotransferase [Candidatus Desulfaltia bathyphila]MBL7195767.1 DegT/DnrJ/EryC1/StrS family aminotransferase [Desulfobacterales bacterium]MBL7207875.1 DegT/DnrJ/EryC1/StrS family aminotransferase [Desulfobacterales bacterium]
MKVPLLDLKSQYKTIKDDVLKVVEEIFESQYFILGPHVEALEKEIAGYCRTRHAVGVSSGTDALLISLMAAHIGHQAGVITTPYTFFATAGSIVRAGARPVFVDIDPNTYNISPECIDTVIADMSEEERGRLKAIMPVHLYGQCVDMQNILKIAEKYNLIVIEDAAQAIGAEHNGMRAGAMGDFGCFSFFPSKNLGAFGDGGIVTTNSEALNDKLRILRVHGGRPKYYHKMIGGNFRLDALQAAIVSIKLSHLDNWTKARQENARNYRELFADANIGDLVRLPLEKENRHIYNQFVISLKEKRDELRLFLNSAGIGTEIYYPAPLHLQECFSYLNYKKGDFPAAEYAASHTLAIPIYPGLSDDQQGYVVEKIKEFVRL